MTVSRLSLVRCFWRSLFIQAAWNRLGLQNLGFAYCIEPALSDLYRDSDERRAALRRHIGFFNCHPYTGAAVLGGAIYHESRAAAGKEPAGSALSYKQTLQGPLAALGDGFFWTALRPFFGTLAAVGAILFGWPAIAVTILLYNVIHLAFRIRLFRLGYEKGDAIVADIARLALPKVAEYLRIAGVVLCGLAAGLFFARGSGRDALFSGAVAAIAAAFGYVALVRGARPILALYAVVMVGAALVLIASRWYGST